MSIRTMPLVLHSRRGSYGRYHPAPDQLKPLSISSLNGRCSATRTGGVKRRLPTNSSRGLESQHGPARDAGAAAAEP